MNREKKGMLEHGDRARFHAYHSPQIMSLLLILATAVISACGSDPAAPDDPDDSTPTVASIVVTPDAAALAVGETVSLTAEASDASGNVVQQATFAWQSSLESVATVTADGLVTAIGMGTANITATSGGASGSATASVLTVSLAAVRDLGSDAFIRAVIANVGGAANANLTQAIDGILQGLADGDIGSSQTALTEAQSLIAAPATGDDVILFAVLDLVFDYFEEILAAA